MQWRSPCSSWFLLASTAPSSCWSRRTPDTLMMVRPLSQQKDWSNVKWICRATSSALSAARTHRTTLSGSLGRKRESSYIMSYSHQHMHVWDGYKLFSEMSEKSVFNSRVQKFSWLIDANRQAVLFLSSHQQLLQSQTYSLHPERETEQWTFCT